MARTQPILTDIFLFVIVITYILYYKNNEEKTTIDNYFVLLTLSYICFRLSLAFLPLTDTQKQVANLYRLV